MESKSLAKMIMNKIFDLKSPSRMLDFTIKQKMDKKDVNLGDQMKKSVPDPGKRRPKAS